MVVLCLSIMILQNYTMSIYIDARINELTHENSLLKTHLRKVEYSSLYMGTVNGAFPINSEKIILKCFDSCKNIRSALYPEYKNIHYFYNLKILEMDWKLLDYPVIYSELNIPNNNVKKLIFNGYDYSYGEKKIFENFPNLEELEINTQAIDFGGRVIDISPKKFCNPSTKLKKIVFNKSQGNMNDFIDFSPIILYYSSRSVEIVINLVL